MSTRANTSAVSLGVLGFFLGCCLLVTSATLQNEKQDDLVPTAKLESLPPGKFFTPSPSGIPESLRYPMANPVPEKKWYSGKKILTRHELSFLLHEAGFRGKAHRLAWIVAMGESTGRPGSFNKTCCHGLFQINMNGSMKADRLSRYKLNTIADLYDPLVNSKVAFHMSRKGTNWSAWTVNPYERSAAEYPGVVKSLPKS